MINHRLLLRYVQSYSPELNTDRIGSINKISYAQLIGISA